jgi:hypothetical protein
MTCACPNRLDVNCACEMKRAAGAVPTWCKWEDAAAWRKRGNFRCSAARQTRLSIYGDVAGRGEIGL